MSPYFGKTLVELVALGFTLHLIRWVSIVASDVFRLKNKIKYCDVAAIVHKYI
jgi:hypothetical protein